MTEKAKAFAALHVKGAPLVLYNCWDVGSASAIAAGGAAALATGSWAVAAAQGYKDGEALPMEMLIGLAGRIASAHDIPLSVDFEGGYGDTPDKVAANVLALQQVGVVGINFEDRRVHAEGIWPVQEHCARIAAIRAAVGPDFFINARTDLFLQAAPDTHSDLLEEAVTRGQAYAAAGASGFFVPKLSDAASIKQICAEVPLPVNVMMHVAMPEREILHAAGVARISYGPSSYAQTMKALTEAASLATNPMT